MVTKRSFLGTAVACCNNRTIVGSVGCSHTVLAVDLDVKRAAAENTSNQLRPAQQLGKSVDCIARHRRPNRRILASLKVELFSARLPVSHS